MYGVLGGPRLGWPLVWPGRVVGGLWPVDHCGVRGSIGRVGVVGGPVEGGPGRSERTRRSCGSRVVLLVLLGVEIQKPTERAVGICLEKRRL